MKNMGFFPTLIEVLQDIDRNAAEKEIKRPIVLFVDGHPASVVMEK